MFVSCLLDYKSDDNVLVLNSLINYNDVVITMLLLELFSLTLCSVSRCRQGMNSSVSENHTNNTTECEEYWSGYFTVAFTTILAIVWLGGVITNAIIVYLLVFKKHLVNATNILLGNLSVGTLIYFLFGVSVSIVAIANGGRWPGNASCQMNGIVTVFAFCVVWQGHGIIAAERFAKIVFPMKTVFTMKRSRAVIACTWIVSLFVALIPVVGVSSNSYSIADSRIVCTIDFSSFGSPIPAILTVIMSISLGTMLCSQLGVYRVARRIRIQTQNRDLMHGINKFQGALRQKCAANDIKSLVSIESSESLEAARIRRISDDIYQAVASFQSSILFIVMFVLPIFAYIVVANANSKDLSICDVKANPSFYVTIVQVGLAAVDLAFNPLVYVSRNLPMKKGLCRLFKRGAQ